MNNDEVRGAENTGLKKAINAGSTFIGKTIKVVEMGPHMITALMAKIGKLLSENHGVRK